MNSPVEEVITGIQSNRELLQRVDEHLSSAQDILRGISLPGSTNSAQQHAGRSSTAPKKNTRASGSSSAGSTAPKKSAASSGSTAPKHQLSEEGRKKIQKSAKKRWEAARKAGRNSLAS